MERGQTVYANLEPWNDDCRYSTEYVIERIYRDGTVKARPLYSYRTNRRGETSVKPLAHLDPIRCHPDGLDLARGA